MKACEMAKEGTAAAICSSLEFGEEAQNSKAVKLAVIKKNTKIQ